VSLQIPHWLSLLVGIPFLVCLLTAVIFLVALVMLRNTDGVQVCWRHRQTGFSITTANRDKKPRPKRLRRH
jgi:hypothetical protein